jgi:hypothetical protein
MGQRILRAVRSGQDALAGAGSAVPQITPWRLASGACAMPQNAVTRDPGSHVTGWDGRSWPGGSALVVAPSA